MSRQLKWLIILISAIVAGCSTIAQQSMPMTNGAETARESPLTVVESYVADHRPMPLETTTYTSVEAAFELTLPDSWSNQYGVVEVHGEAAHIFYPQAQHVVTFVYLPMVPDLTPQPLLALYLFGQREWEAIGRDVSDKLGRSVAETETQVYVAAIARASGYPEGSADAELFERMLLSNQEVRDLIRVGDLTATTDADELAAARWVWRDTLISDGSVTVPPGAAQAATEAGAAYMLEFGKDRQVQIWAGCRMGQGAYIATNGRMQIEVTEMDANTCPPDIVGDEFLRWLEQAAGYFFSGEDLVIVLAMDSGSVSFVRAES